MIEKILADRRIRLLIVCVVLSVVLITFKGITTGLDLQGGSIIQIQTERPLDAKEMDQVVTIMDERLRGGLAVRDVKVRPWGDEFVVVEIAGVDPEDAEKLIGKPGKLVVKIGNISVFTGDELTRVDPFAYDPYRATWGVPFAISSSAAERFRDAAIETNFAEVYMYLDDIEVNKAPISNSLRQNLIAGEIVKSLILETGREDEGKDEARRIETILRSGALPIKVDIVGSYGVSAALGEDFAKSAILAGMLALVGVFTVVYLRYREPIVVLPIITTGFSEVLIVLGVASLINWNIDLPAIAGIIAVVGTGVDNQIVILDEILLEKERSIRYRIKSAFFIVIGSWMTLVAAMLPLFIVGMAALKGFAVTTIIGATAGVFITRPAYAKILEYLMK